MITLLGILAGALATIFLSVSSILGVVSLHIVLRALRALGAGRLYAGADDSDFALGRAWTQLAAIMGMLLAAIGVVLSKESWIWCVSVLAIHGLVLVLNSVTERWNCSLVSNWQRDQIEAEFIRRSREARPAKCKQCASQLGTGVCHKDSAGPRNELVVACEWPEGECLGEPASTRVVAI